MKLLLTTALALLLVPVTAARAQAPVKIPPAFLGTWQSSGLAPTISPFGGYKASGIGRQNGIEAVYQYLQTKSVWCELGDEVQDPFIMKV